MSTLKTEWYSPFHIQNIATWGISDKGMKRFVKREIAGRFAATLPATLVLLGASIIQLFGSVVCWGEAGLSRAINSHKIQNWTWRRALSQSQKTSHFVLASVLSPFAGLYSPTTHLNMLQKYNIIPLQTQFIENRTQPSQNLVNHHSFYDSAIEASFPQDKYTQHLRDFYEIYKALELNLICKRDNLLIKEIYIEKIFLASSLAQDMIHLSARSLTPSKEACDYASYLKSITEPHLLIAHAYVLHYKHIIRCETSYGTQSLYKKFQNKWRFAFFYIIYESEVLIKQYKDVIDNLPLTTQQLDQIVIEADKAYLWTKNLLDHLMEINRGLPHEKLLCSS